MKVDDLLEELTNDQLQSVCGGIGPIEKVITCPFCGCVEVLKKRDNSFICRSCGGKWTLEGDNNDQEPWRRK